MSLKMGDLGDELISDALKTGDGWPGRDKKSFSLTVTAEAAIAVAEFLEQSPQPRTSEEATRRAAALNIAEKAEQRVRDDLARRIEDTDLAVWHFAMGLTAVANIRVLLKREGRGLAELDADLITKLVKKIIDKAPRDPANEDAIGSVWAFLRAIELLQRTELAANRDSDLWNILRAPSSSTPLIGELAALAKSLRNQLLATPITTETSRYVAAVELDIAVNALKAAEASMTDREKANADARVSEGLAHLERALAGHSINARLPLRTFEFSGGDTRGERYVVITGPTIVSSLAYALETKGLVNVANKQQFMGYFYSAIKTLSDDIDGGRFWGYGPSHCLRVLSEIQTNKRDSDLALDALRGLRTVSVALEKASEVSAELEQFFDKSPLVFGKPGDNSFIALSSRPVRWVLWLLLANFVAITACVYKGPPWAAAALAAVPACGAIFLAFWKLYADLNGYSELPNRGRASLKLFCWLALFGILSGVASVIGLIFTIFPRT